MLSSYFLAAFGYVAAVSAMPHSQDTVRNQSLMHSIRFVSKSPSFCSELIGRIVRLTPTPVATSSVHSSLDANGEWAINESGNFTLASSTGTSSSSLVFTTKPDKGSWYIVGTELRCGPLPPVLGEIPVPVNALSETVRWGCVPSFARACVNHPTFWFISSLGYSRQWGSRSQSAQWHRGILIGL